MQLLDFFVSMIRIVKYYATGQINHLELSISEPYMHGVICQEHLYRKGPNGGGGGGGGRIPCSYSQGRRKEFFKGGGGTLFEWE